MAKIDKDKKLLSWLKDFSKEKIEESYSQRIEEDIKSLGKELFKENFQLFFPDNSESVYNRENLISFGKELNLQKIQFENHLKNEHTRVNITALINKYYILVYTQLNAKTQNFLSMEQLSKSYSLAHLCISICSEFAKYIHQNISENDISNIINHDKKQTTMKRGSGSVNPHSRKKTAKNME